MGHPGRRGRASAAARRTGPSATGSRCTARRGPPRGRSTASRPRRPARGTPPGSTCRSILVSLVARPAAARRPARRTGRRTRASWCGRGRVCACEARRVQSPQRAAWGHTSRRRRPVRNRRLDGLDFPPCPIRPAAPQRVHRPAAANAGARRADRCSSPASPAARAARSGCCSTSRAGLDRPAVLLCPAGALAARARAAGVPVLRPRAPARAARRGAPAWRARRSRWPRHAARCARRPPPCARGRWWRSGCAAPSPAPRRWRPGAAAPAAGVRARGLPAEPAVARAVRAAAAGPDRVIALSAAVAADLDPRGRLGRAPARGRARHRRESVRGLGPAAADPPTALLLGAIVAWKRPDLALEAVAIAARELPELQLVVAGHTVGEESERLLARAPATRRGARPGRTRGVRRRAGRSARGAGRRVVPAALLRRRALRPGAAGGDGHRAAGGGPRGRRARWRSWPTAAGASIAPGDARRRRAPSWRCWRPGELAPASRPSAPGSAWPSALQPGGVAAAVAGGRRPVPQAAPPTAEAGRGPDAGHGDPQLAAASSSALLRLGRAPPARPPRVVVVDSGSRDESAAVAARRAERVTVARAATTWATAALPTRAWRAVDTPACVVLNPDVELVDDSLAALAAEALRAGAPERLLAPLVLHPDGTRQDSAHPEPVSPQRRCALVPPAALPAAAAPRACSPGARTSRAGGLGGGLLRGGPHRDAAPPRPLRRADLPLRRGPRARPARRGTPGSRPGGGRRPRDPPRGAPTARASAASPTTCWPRSATP